MQNKCFKRLHDLWILIRPYWFSEEKTRGRLLLGAIVGLSLLQVYISVRINQWNAVFYNALQDKQLAVFMHQLSVFTILAACAIAVAVYRQYFSQMLHIEWRQWMTHLYQERWLENRAYYRLQVLHASIDNPDQRIADDVDIFTGSTLTLSIGLLSSVVTLVSFVTILWGLSGVLQLHVFGHAITIPGYMVWAAILYACVGSWLTHKIGHRLIKLNFEKQRYEANYRFALINVRENAETIAFYRGEAIERHSLTQRFNDIFSNWWSIMRKQKQLTWFTSGYSQIANIFPFLVAAPRYFSGAIALGGLTQTASAFAHVQNALSWFIDVYAQFASWKATANRLSAFSSAMQTSILEQPAKEIVIIPSDVFEIKNLSITLPSNTPLLPPFTLRLAAGDRLLISGASGCGKTTLLRAMAGLWPYGQGQILLPENKTLLFIPQKPYLPLLPLRDVICYPEQAAAFDEAALIAALTSARLPALIPLLDTEQRWSSILSPGEQQKLALARILLHQPDILLLDEATASLDAKAEAAFYETVIQKLPHTAIVSIGHHLALQQWHQTHMAL